MFFDGYINMRWIGLILLFVILQSCEKEILDASFNVKLEGFALEAEPRFSEPDQINFKHKYSGGVFYFTNAEKKYTFVVNDFQIEDYIFTLPPGEYLIETGVAEASVYGREVGSFFVAPITVTISEFTDTITIQAEANCSLILVSDEGDELEDGAFMIERHSYASGNFRSYSMPRDDSSRLYYTYFKPDPDLDDPTAFIWFYDRLAGTEQGGVSTTRFELGYWYFFNVLE